MTINKRDWSMYKKGQTDQVRHQEKIKKAIKNNLSDIIGEEALLMPSSGDQKIKIPIRSLKEYKIRYKTSEDQNGMGQGNGASKQGDAVGEGDKMANQGSGAGQGAGESPGEEHYETDVSLEEIDEILFSQLELPHLQDKKRFNHIQTTQYEFNDIRSHGIMGNVDKKKTLLNTLKRNALKGKPSFEGVLKEDLRFKSWTEETKPITNAVVIAMMDVSGSMGIWEKTLAKTFFFWTKRFLNKKYTNVEIVYVGHHTEAKEMTEEQFFSRGESGGTICSSAYRKALELIDDRYSPSEYNIYCFHISDGDNLTSDNQRCTNLINQLAEVSNLVGYGEVNQYNRQSTLQNAYKGFKDKKENVVVSKMIKREDLLKTLKTFFPKEETKK